MCRRGEAYKEVGGVGEGRSRSRGGACKGVEEGKKKIKMETFVRKGECVGGGRHGRGWCKEGKVRGVLGDLRRGRKGGKMETFVRKGE